MLDMKTILICYFATNVLVTILLAVLWWQNRHRLSGLFLWVLDYGLQTVGLFLISLRDVVPDFLSIVVANMLLVGGGWVLYIGLARFVGKPAWQIPNLFAMLIFFVALYQFTFVDSDISARTVVQSMGIWLMTAQCGDLLLRRTGDDLKPATRWVGIVLALYSMVALARVIYLSLNPVSPSTGLFELAPEQALAIFAYNLLTVALVFTLNMMVVHRLQMDIRKQQIEQERTEKTLRESEEQHRLIVQTAMDGFWQLDAQGHFIQVNDAYCRMSGYSEQELLAMRISDVEVIETPEITAAHIQKIIAQGQDCFETRHRRKDGSTFDIEVSAQYRDGRFVGFLRDITERKRMMQALRESEELFSLFMCYSPIYMYIKQVTPTESQVLVASENYKDMIGIPGSQMVGKTMPELFPAEFAAKISADDWDVVSKGQVLKLDEDLNDRHYTTIKFPIVMGDRTLLAGYTIDITERRQAEKDLSIALVKYKTLFETFPMGITVSDKHGNIIETNRIAEKLLGISTEEQLSRNIDGPQWQIVRPDRTPMSADEYASVRALKENRLIENVEMGIVQLPNETTWINVTAAPIPLEGYGVVVVYGDITERKQMEDREREQGVLTEALSDSAAALNSSLNFDDVLDRILENVGRVVPHDSVAVFLLDATHQIAQIVRYRDNRDKPVDMKGLQFSVPQTRNLCEMQATGLPVLITDTCTYDGWIATSANTWIRASLGVPIKVENEVIGFLILASAIPDAFTSLDAQRLQSFVDYSAIAIENARLYAEVKQLAITDVLTGLFNRLFFEAELARLELGRDFPISIIVGDVDNLKITNDTLGHAAGDDLLRAIAQIMQETFRAGDIIARIGGDEFAVLLPKTDATMAGQMVSRICAKLAEYNAKYPSLPIQLSVGTATAEQGKLSPVLAIADQRMYDEKARRKSS